MVQIHTLSSLLDVRLDNAGFLRTTLSVINRITRTAKLLIIFYTATHRF